MLRRRSASRLMVLMGASALGLHSLRYLLAPVADPSGLAGRHAYLTWLGPLVATALAGALGGLLARSARRTAARPSSRLTMPAATLAAAAALVIAFVAQESLESILSGAGLAGLSVSLGSGGWMIVPLALGLGVTIALLTRQDTVLVLSATAPSWRPRELMAARLTPRPLLLVARRPPSRHLAGRSPPLTSEG